MKRQLTKKQRMLREHNVWLQSMGISGGKAKKPKGIYSMPDLSVKSTHKTSDSIGNGYVKRQHKYTGSNNLCVGQAYNKGNYVVLSEKEAKDPATGKRRT